MADAVIAAHAAYAIMRAKIGAPALRKLFAVAKAPTPIASSKPYCRSTTSMESMGFAELRPDLAADGLLPMSLTDLGKRLAHEFEKCVPEGFLNLLWQCR